jgi:quinol monooxygenase YgiN
VLVAVLTFDVQPRNRVEFVGAVTRVAQIVRWSAGCLGCRLVSDCEDRNHLTLVSEWDNRNGLDRFLASAEFQILEGTRFLLRAGPTLSVDEVISRRRRPGSARRIT